MFQWHVLTIGHLSRNKFWGEDEQQAYRSPLCTCTLLQGEDVNVIIDPSLPAEQMKEALLNAAGISPEAITHTYSTHYHGDHHWDLSAFPNAVCCMPRKDLEELRANEEEIAGKVWTYLKHEQIARLVPAEDNLVPGLNMVPLPGHTEGLSGYLFNGPEGRILCTGDCVMTREFFKHNTSYFFGWNVTKCEESIRKIKAMEPAPDIIVPGHGEAFLVKAYR